MSEKQKELIEETVENLKHLDKESLLIIKCGTEMLRSRDLIEQKQEEENETQDAISM